MSDNPTALKNILLSEADTETQKAFAALLAEQCATHERQKTHKCSFFVPSPTEYERMKKFAVAPDYDKCPKCRKGRVLIETTSWSMGESMDAVCKWGEPGCDFKESIDDPDKW